MSQRAQRNVRPVCQPWQTTKQCPCRHRRASGFTLVELLVVISIIALLISILLPSLKGARDQAKLLSCGTNLSQFGKAMTMYATEWNGALPRGIWETQRTGGDDEAREFYWELYWSYLGLPTAPTYQDKLNFAAEAGVLHCPAYKLPAARHSQEWKQTRSYAVNEHFQPDPVRDRFNRISYPYPLAKLGNVKRPSDTCYMADTTGDSKLVRRDLALMFDPPPIGDKSDDEWSPRHREGKFANVQYLDTHVEAEQLGQLPPLDLPETEAEYYDAHAFWNGRKSLSLDDKTN